MRESRCWPSSASAPLTQLQAADDQREKDKAEQEGRGSGASARGKKVDQAPRRCSVMGTLQSVARAATVMQSNRRSNPQVQPSDDVDDPEHERPREWASCRRSCSLDTSAKAHLGSRSSPCDGAGKQRLSKLNHADI